jgi:UDP-N-acetylmuramate dehydrogenase
MKLDIQQQVSLQPFNTLAIDVCAEYFVEAFTTEHIVAALKLADKNNWPTLILGGGSNIVLTSDFQGLVIKILLQGVTAKQHGDDVFVTAGAGENWHQLVLSCLQQGFYGLENLSLIPGTVGAAPIQNIGAYGVELQQLFVSLTGWDLNLQQWRILTVQECDFAYRDSIFKQSLKDQFIITSVTLRLSLSPRVNINYAGLALYLKQQEISAPSPQQVSKAVIAIRQSKLPDPKVLANVGSFFKNPIIDHQQAKSLQEKYPELVRYQQHNGQVKLAAAWLLQQAGWKGKCDGAVGMHDQQSIVLINYGQGSGRDVLALADKIKRDIEEHFSICLEIEPRIY